MSDLPQLRMRHRRLAELSPVPPLPEGYSLRLASLGDVSRLAGLLETAFEMPWTEAQVREVLLENAEVPKTFVIEFDGEIVATASYQVHPERFPGSGWVHYVAVDPQHAGKRLGAIVTAMVLHESLERGHEDVGLTTDDLRIPAIKTYLRLGFEPDMWHPSHSERWAIVLDQIPSNSNRS